MSQGSLTTPEIQRVIPMARPTMLGVAAQLPIARHGRAGRVRNWTLKDAAILAIANKLVEQGLSTAVAVDIAGAVEPHVGDVLAKLAERNPLPTFAVCWAGCRDERGRHAVSVSDDATRVGNLAFPDPQNGAGAVVIVDVSATIAEMLEKIANLRKAEVADNGDE